MEDQNQQNNDQGQQQKQSEQQESQAPQSDNNAPAQDGGSNQNDQAPAGDAKDIEENRAITYLSYIGILFLVPLLAKKESKFAVFHAKQGLVLVIGSFLGMFLVPVFGIGMIVHLAVIVLSIMGLVNVHKGEMTDLPIVGDIAKKFNF